MQSRGGVANAQNVTSTNQDGRSEVIVYPRTAIEKNDASCVIERPRVRRQSDLKEQIAPMEVSLGRRDTNDSNAFVIKSLTQKRIVVAS